MIYELLSEGESNAKPAKRICEQLNINERELTQQINRERRAGKPICASSGKKPGYYIAKSITEMQDYCNRLLHRAGEIHKTRRACICTIETLPAESEEQQATEI